MSVLIYVDASVDQPAALTDLEEVLYPAPLEGVEVHA
jgi:hypothetical protein